MNDTILIAIISASSALLGALIPTIITYLNNKEQNELELKRDLLNNQKNAYKQLMLSLQKLINNFTDDDFKELQKAIIEFSIYGDNLSSKAMNIYYSEMTNASNGLRPLLSNVEHKQFQMEIMNGIRKNLGLEEFESFEIVAFRPN